MTLTGMLMAIGEWMGPEGSYGAAVALSEDYDLCLPLTPEECRRIAGALYKTVRVTITVEAVEEAP